LLLIIGLGNPGPRYEATRHNVGFMLVDRLTQVYGIECDTPGWKSRWGRGEIAGREVVLVKPETFMNASGEAVAWFAGALSLGAANLLVAYDDTDLPLGRIRVKARGGSGGHRGMESIIDVLGTSDFTRIRLGIGRPDTGELTDYVLAPFDGEEGGAVDDMLSRAADSVEVIITEGMVSAMNAFNSNA
jgi:PTH1 family peptidyl-tRNA hydrolase